MEVKIKKLHKDAVIPTKATNGAAAYDVYTPIDYKVVMGRQVLPLDFAIEIPIGYEAKIEPRSGFSSKGFEGYFGRLFENNDKCRFDADVITGKIDSDYRGNVGVIIRSNEPYFFIPKGTRIAQMTIYKVENADFVISEKLSETERADGGFGHTGTK